MDSKLKRVSFNMLASIIKNFFILLLSFVSTPFILKHLGNENYGYYKLIGDWLGHIGILEVSISAVFVSEISKRVGVKKDLAQILKTGLIQYFKILIIIWLSCSILYFFIDDLVNLKEVYRKDFLFAFLIISFAFLFLPLMPFKISLEANERSDIVSMIMVGQNLLIIISSMIFAYLSFGITGQAISFSGGLLVTYLVIVVYSLKQNDLSLKSIFASKASVESKKITWELGKSSFLVNLFHRVSNNSGNILIAYFFSAKEVIPFYLTQRLAHIALNQTTNIGNSSWATVISSYHSGDKTAFESRFYEVNKIICLLGASFITPIIIWNGDFIGLWIGPENYAGPTLTILSCSLVIILSLLSFWGQVLNAIGKIKEQKFPSVVSGIIILTLGIYLTKKLGMIGPLLSPVITFFIFSCWYYFYLFKKSLNLSFQKLFFTIIPVMIFTFVWAIVFFKLKNLISLEVTWLNIILQTGGAFLIFSLSSFFILLNEREKNIWRLRFGRVFSKK